MQQCIAGIFAVSGVTVEWAGRSSVDHSPAPWHRRLYYISLIIMIFLTFFTFFIAGGWDSHLCASHPFGVSFSLLYLAAAYFHASTGAVVRQLPDSS